MIYIITNTYIQIVNSPKFTESFIMGAGVRSLGGPANAYKFSSLTR